jgi:arsenate reductase
MTRLRDAGMEYESINYIIEPPTRQKLAELVAKIGSSPRDIVRTKEPEYRELGLDNPSLTDDDILDALAKHPSLIQRPIIEYGSHAILARPAERVTEAMREWGVGRDEGGTREG